MEDNILPESAARPEWPVLKPGTEETRAALAERANALPLRPGVYIMRDRNDKVIYVGKSRSLRNRVSQYFHESASHSEKTRRMVSTSAASTISSATQRWRRCRSRTA